jgi:L-asparaginase
MSARILVINTGGTLTMEATTQGYVPMRGFLEKVQRLLPESTAMRLPAFDYDEWQELLDSSNIEPLHWTQLARRIAGASSHYDGFVVLHGTDTMAYTASALSFLLQGLGKPVIVTGSQQPLGSASSDAPVHWATALTAAAESRLPEVAIVFSGKLLRGCRSTKINAADADAFASPRHAALGLTTGSLQATTTWHYQRDRWLPPPAAHHFSLYDLHPQAVRILFWAPGQPASLLDGLEESPCRVLIVCLYGSGNGPHLNRAFMHGLQKLCDGGMTVLTISQCLYGQLTGSVYETGLALEEIGVRHGHGMTIEAAYTKMMVLASGILTNSDLGKQSVKNLCGELD